jgi:hypothetical protein
MLQTLITKEQVFGELPEIITQPIYKQQEICQNSSGEYYNPKFGLYNLYTEDENGIPVKIGGQVTRDYPLTQHPKFFGDVEDILLENIDHNLVTGEDAVTTYTKTSHNGAFAQREYIFNNLKTKIDNPRFETELAYRVIVWHGLGGIASNNFRAGAIDFFCSNGMISGEFNAVTMKNTKNFELGKFVAELQNATINFNAQVEKYQRELNTEITIKKAQQFIEKITKHDFSKDAERKRQTKALAHNLLEQIGSEFKTRGNNIFAVRSALTDWSTHGDTRKTNIDHVAKTRLEREQKVTQWTNSQAFEELALVA